MSIKFDCIEGEIIITVTNINTLYFSIDFADGPWAMDRCGFMKENANRIKLETKVHEVFTITQFHIYIPVYYRVLIYSFENTSRHLQPGECPSTGLLCDCDIVKLQTSRRFVSSSTAEQFNLRWETSFIRSSEAAAAAPGMFCCR